MGEAYLEIPYDILFQILLKLPVKSLLPLTAVCKAWRAMIFFDPDFTRAHCKITEKNTKFKHVINIIKDFEDILGPINPSNFFWYVFLDKTKVSLPFYDHTVLDAHFEIFAACNGILLVGFGDKDHYLWNPTTGSHKKLSINFYHSRKDVRMYGLWFDSCCNAFKAIMIVKMKYDKKTIVRIYNSGTDSWEEIGEFPYEVLYEQQGLLWNGTPYWIVGSRDSSGLKVINFHEDKFKEIDFPVSVVYDIKLLEFFRGYTMKFAVLNGVLHLFIDYRVWTMKEIGGSWVEWKDEFYKLDFDHEQQLLHYVTYFETPISPHIGFKESDE